MGKPRRTLLEPVTTLAAWGAAALVGLAFLWLAAEVLRTGADRLSLPFLISPPEDAGRSGGIGPILVSTALILAVSTGVSAAIGLPAAVLLAELSDGRGRFGAVVRRSLDLLGGMPSVVFGLFGNAFFCGLLGLRFSILSGGLTLACMVLPLLIRTSEEALRSVPRSYREAAAALALSRTTLLRRVLLPAALPGLGAGLVLGTGRALAETAALLFTSGYVSRMPESLLDSGRALSVHIYDLSLNVAGGDASAGASALVLMVAILALNGLTEWLAGCWLRPGEAGR